MTKLASVALTGIFALGMIAAPAAFAEDGTTAKGGSSSANSGSSGDKTDKSTQENANSADKDKQQK